MLAEANHSEDRTPTGPGKSRILAAAADKKDAKPADDKKDAKPADDKKSDPKATPATDKPGADQKPAGATAGTSIVADAQSAQEKAFAAASTDPVKLFEGSPLIVVSGLNTILDLTPFKCVVAEYGVDPILVGEAAVTGKKALDLAKGKKEVENKFDAPPFSYFASVDSPVAEVSAAPADTPPKTDKPPQPASSAKPDKKTAAPPAKPSPDPSPQTPLPQPKVESDEGSRKVEVNGGIVTFTASIAAANKDNSAAASPAKDGSGSAAEVPKEIKGEAAQMFSVYLFSVTKGQVGAQPQPKVKEVVRPDGTKVTVTVPPPAYVSAAAPSQAGSAAAPTKTALVFKTAIALLVVCASAGF